MSEDLSHIEPTSTSLVPASELSRGSKVSLWLLWLFVGLPTSALVFLLVPSYVALHGVEWLEAADVPLEVWTELKPWVGLSLLAAVVNHQASFRHRRPAMSESSRKIIGQMWLTLGVLAGGAWLGLLGLEHLPETELLPELHYLALSGTMVWAGLSLAWLSGRGVSLVLVGVERRAQVSPALRGGLGTAGPLSAVAVLAVGASVGLDTEGRIDEARALAAGTFEDEWSVLDEFDDQGEARSEIPKSRRPDQFDECIERLYENGTNSIYWKGVHSIASYGGVDWESVASETALSVCSREVLPRQLEPYFIRSVHNRARTAHRSERRFGVCSVGEYRMPSGETMEDCMYEQLCKLDEPDKSLVVGLLLGQTASEVAKSMAIPAETAKKRRSRAKRRFVDVVRRECAN